MMPRAWFLLVYHMTLRLATICYTFVERSLGIRDLRDSPLSRCDP
jgi:hypothetical protein